MKRDGRPTSRQTLIEVPGYELFECIGEGGSAEVWRARHRLLGREAAVKVLRTDEAASELMRERFKLEARCAASTVFSCGGGL